MLSPESPLSHAYEAAIAPRVKEILNGASSDILRKNLGAFINPGAEPSLATQRRISETTLTPEVIFALAHKQDALLVPAVQVYRPISRAFDDLEDGDPAICSIHGFEACARGLRMVDGRATIAGAGPLFWLSQIYHDKFDIQMAETAWALGSAISASTGDALRDRTFVVSSNITEALITRDDFADVFTRIAEGQSTHLRQEIELVETIPPSALTGNAITQLRKLTEEGTRLAIDDLGEGYSEKIFEILSQKGIPVSTIKISGEKTYRLESDHGRLEVRDLILKCAGGSSTVDTIVFEGHPRGLKARHIEEIRALTSAPQIWEVIADIKLLLEGTITPDKHGK